MTRSKDAEPMAYGYRLEGTSALSSFLADPFYFTRARPELAGEKTFADRNLCGVWFFRDLESIDGRLFSPHIVSRLNLDRIAGCGIEPDPCYDGQAFVLTHPIPDGAEPSGQFVKEVCLPPPAASISGTGKTGWRRNLSWTKAKP